MEPSTPSKPNQWASSELPAMSQAATHRHAASMLPYAHRMGCCGTSLPRIKLLGQNPQVYEINTAVDESYVQKHRSQLGGTATTQSLSILLVLS